ncbi:MAG: hypothetical protein WC551_13185 [Patescibacteria group bacterium]
MPRENYVAVSMLFSFNRKVRKLDAISRAVIHELWALCKRTNSGGRLEPEKFTPDEIAYLCNITERDGGEARAAESIEAIKKSGICEVEEDGSINFPSFKKWNPSFSRTGEGQKLRRDEKKNELYYGKEHNDAGDEVDDDDAKDALGKGRLGEVRLGKGCLPINPKEPPPLTSEAKGAGQGGGGGDSFAWDDRYISERTQRYFGVPFSLYLVKSREKRETIVDAMRWHPPEQYGSKWDAAFQQAADAIKRAGAEVTPDNVAAKVLYVVSCVTTEGYGKPTPPPERKVAVVNDPVQPEPAKAPLIDKRQERDGSFVLVNRRTGEIVGTEPAPKPRAQTQQSVAPEQHKFDLTKQKAREIEARKAWEAVKAKEEEAAEKLELQKELDALKATKLPEPKEGAK